MLCMNSSLSKLYGGACDPPLEYDNKKQVEPDVEDGRDDQEIQGSLRITQSPQYGAGSVEPEKRHEACHDDGQVGGGFRHQFIRKVDQAKDPPGEDNTHNRQYNSGDEQKDIHGLDGPLDPFHVPGPEILGDDDGATEGHADDQGDQGEDDGEGGADCGQGIFAQKIPHDDGVYDVVELLEQVAQQHGHCEIENEPGRFSCREIPHGLLKVHKGG
jgi:hypothetical protein